MKERIKQLMEQQHMNQQAFSAFTGISTATLSGIFNGRTNPTIKIVQDIKAKFPDVSTDWLLYGTGGMLKTYDDASSTHSADGNAVSGQGNLFGGATMDQNGASANTDNVAEVRATQPSLFDVPSASSAPQSRNASVAGVKVMQQPQQPAGRNMPYGAQAASYQVPTPQPARRITEIRVFYDDQTWESFVPKNK